MRAALLVPRREGEPVRDGIWDWLHRDWWPPLGLPVIEGHHTDGPFNRSAAVNTAAAAADQALGGRWDVAVVLDADTIVDLDAVRSAVTLAHASGQITWAYERFAALTQAGTDKILDGYTGDWEPLIDWAVTDSASSCLAVPRLLWDRIGGFDERFTGWSWEDVAFSLAAQAIGGGRHRIAGTAWHLWHPPAPACGDVDHPIYVANKELAGPYMYAGWGNHDAMQAVLQQAGQWERFR